MVISCVVTEDMPVPIIDQIMNRLIFTRICLSKKIVHYSLPDKDFGLRYRSISSTTY